MIFSMLPFWDFGPSFLVDLGVFWQKWFSQSCLFGMMKFFLFLEVRSKFGRFPDSAGTSRRPACLLVHRVRAVFGKTDFPRTAFCGVSELAFLEKCSGVCAGVFSGGRSSGDLQRSSGVSPGINREYFCREGIGYLGNSRVYWRDSGLGPPPSSLILLVRVCMYVGMGTGYVVYAVSCY